MSTTSPEDPRSDRSPEEARRFAAAGERIMALVREQVSLGPRVPGTPPHDLLVERLEAALRSAAAEVTVQQFTVPFRGRSLPCRNVVGVFRAAPDVAAPARRRVPALLLGTHFDTRIRADRDPDPSRREQPIPGANDGGSGTAILLHMLPGLAAGRFAGDLAVAFLDAEDLGNIDGKEFALGAAWLARHPVPGFVPEQAVMLDMVGGRRMILDIDAHSLAHLPSRRLTTEVFAAAASRGSQPFARDKPRRLKYIISDHAPFVAAGVAACILIDIDYPEWHTQADLPGAMSEESLAAIEEALWLFLSPRRC